MRISSLHRRGHRIILFGEKEAKRIAALRHGRPIVMIDIAVPRDIDPVVSDIEGVYLFNIDALETL